MRAPPSGYKMRKVLDEYVATFLYLVIPFMCTAHYQIQTPGVNERVIEYVLFLFAYFLFWTIVLFPRVHLNPVVTIVTVISKDVGMKQGLLNIFGQVWGAITAASVAHALYGKQSGSEFMCNIIHIVESDQMANVLEHEDSSKWWSQVYTADALGTMLAEFCFTGLFALFYYKLNVESRPMHHLIIDRLSMATIIASVYYAGLKLTWAHDSGSLNPARTFAPALVNTCHELYAHYMEQDHAHFSIQALGWWKNNEQMFGLWDSFFIILSGTMSAGVVVGLFGRWTKKNPIRANNFKPRNVMVQHQM